MVLGGCITPSTLPQSPQKEDEYPSGLEALSMPARKEIKY